MLHRYLPANPTLTDRWGHLLFWLFEGMALDWRRRGLRHVHHGEITQRILGLWKRLRSVLEQHRAGTLRAPRGRQQAMEPGSEESTPHPDPPAQGGRKTNSASAWQRVLPRTFGWLKSLLLPDRQYCVNAFNLLLIDDAEMQTVIAAAPVQIGRVLRPFCHFLGLEVPAGLRLAKRRRVRAKDTSPRPSPHSGEGEVVAVHRKRRAAREIAEALMARSERTGKPVDIRKVSSVVWGYIVHTPRDGNCPPPEIGYGGRRWRPPKDYQPPRDED
jgi:hypothetical protein